MWSSYSASYNSSYPLSDPAFNDEQSTQNHLSAFQRTLQEEDERFYATFPQAKHPSSQWPIGPLYNHTYGDYTFYQFPSHYPGNKALSPVEDHYDTSLLNTEYELYAEQDVSLISLSPITLDGDYTPALASTSADARSVGNQNDQPDVLHQQDPSLLLVAPQDIPVPEPRLGSPIEDYSFSPSHTDFPAVTVFPPPPSPEPIMDCLPPAPVSPSPQQPVMQFIKEDSESSTSLSVAADNPLSPMSEANPRRHRKHKQKSRKSVTISPVGKAKSKGDLKEPGKQDRDKKVLSLACFFCRHRKIACGQADPSSPDKTCNQCLRRSLKCEYPSESRRGMRKKKLEHDGNELESPIPQ